MEMPEFRQSVNLFRIRKYAEKAGKLWPNFPNCSLNLNNVNTLNTSFGTSVNRSVRIHAVYIQ